MRNLQQRILELLHAQQRRCALIAPDSEDNWSIFKKLNGNSAEISSEAAGISFCLLNWNHHACRTGSPAMSEHYYHLREPGVVFTSAVITRDWLRLNLAGLER